MYNIAGIGNRTDSFYLARKVADIQNRHSIDGHPDHLLGGVASVTLFVPWEGIDLLVRVTDELAFGKEMERLNEQNPFSPSTNLNSMFPEKTIQYPLSRESDEGGVLVPDAVKPADLFANRNVVDAFRFAQSVKRGFDLDNEPTGLNSDLMELIQPIFGANAPEWQEAYGRSERCLVDGLQGSMLHVLKEVHELGPSRRSMSQQGAAAEVLDVANDALREVVRAKKENRRPNIDAKELVALLKDERAQEYLSGEIGVGPMMFQLMLSGVIKASEYERWRKASDAG